MNPDRAVELLRARIEDGKAVLGGSSNFERWRTTTKVTLERIYGHDHTIVSEFEGLRYTPAVVTSGTNFGKYRDAGIARAISIVEAAIYEREQLGSAEANAEAFDAELWEHVSHLVEAEQWGQVASVTSTFLESKLREWAGLSVDDYGKNLMIKVFKPDAGKFPCGNTDGEEQGWQQLATGFVQAVSNVDRHRIQKRDDAKPYARGVLGAASLIITQLRYQHGTRFRTT
jgi:hypothetical protein